MLPVTKMETGRPGHGSGPASAADALRDERQRRRPGRDPGGRDGYQRAGADPDGLLLGDVLARLWRR